MRTATIESPVEHVIQLPQPERGAGMSLHEALKRRRSVREFTGRILTNEQLSQLLWAAQGITGVGDGRTAPSAGALYPLEIYVATPTGLFHYEPRAHQLKRWIEGDVRKALSRAALDQSAVSSATAVFVIAAEYARTAQKYGPVRSPRYVHLESGHVAQNLLLEATALGLGSVPVGAFEDEQVQRVLRLPNREVPVYMVAVGSL